MPFSPTHPNAPFTCDDCLKTIQTPEDEISYFNSSRCAKCEALMFKYMADVDAEHNKKQSEQF